MSAGFMIYGIIKFKAPDYGGADASIERDFYVYSWQQGINMLYKVANHYGGKGYVLHYGKWKPISIWPKK